MAVIETALSALESAILSAMADQLDDVTRQTLIDQVARASVICRKNSGAGFFTNFKVEGPASGLPDLRGLNAAAQVDGLQHGLDFVLWTKDGRLDYLEGYTRGPDSTENLDLAAIGFRLIDLNGLYRS